MKSKPMTARQLRRALAHKERKAERKTGFPTQQPSQPQPEPAPAVAPPPEDTQPSKPPSEARLAANAQNAAKSHGALTPETKAISAQNHTIHGLARHQPENFKVLSSESPNAFEALKLSLMKEHEPSTKTESILVENMAQSHWLSPNSALRLQDTCLDPETGKIADDKKFSLYMRYQTTHTRAFHKCLNDLLKLRKENRKAELGVVAQRLKEEAQRIETEKHEMKKSLHGWEEMRKDALACQQVNILTTMRVEASKQNPNCIAEYEAELARRGLKMDIQGLAYHAV